MNKLRLFLIALIIHCAVFNMTFAQQDAQIPDPPREFRGVWVATVSNIDWPSKKGLSADKQKKELTDMFDKFQAAKMNAVVFQIRPTGDALYDSPYEPWASYLTGTIGQSPGYDPLSFAIEEAHKRNMELHAWFNPFRLATGKKPAHPKHAVNTQPDIAIQYDRYFWMDPTDERSHEYVLKIIGDVVDRYDVDAIHFDDYFFPYPITTEDVFPDTDNWEKFKETGGYLSRPDWRRLRVNEFIQKTDKLIKEKKPSVRFGISPFGIWRPGNPSSIKGMDAYDALYADSRLWLREGWIDYFSPQLYWSIDSSGQSFTTLLDWWEEQNTKGRHLWPGLGLYRINSGGSTDYKAQEILDQIEVTQKSDKTTGVIMFSAKQFSGNHDRVYDKIKAGPYRLPALVPASPWLDSTPPEAPLANITQTDGTNTLTWQTRGETPKQFVVYVLHKGKWWIEIIPGTQKSLSIHTLDANDTIAISAIDEVGNESARTVLKMK